MVDNPNLEKETEPLVADGADEQQEEMDTDENNLTGLIDNKIAPNEREEEEEKEEVETAKAPSG
jgi:hypothetical protein